MKNGNAIISPKFNLPKDAITEGEAPCAGNAFDVYIDEYGGIYWYYEGTNVLHSYEPYTENLKIGNGIVDSVQAIDLANDFLEITGYDQVVNGYEDKISYDHSKDYTIEYSSTTNNKKLVFHMQAEEGQSSRYGRVYITGFSAYVENYDS